MVLAEAIGTRKSALYRIRFQLLGGLLFAIGLPSILRGVVDPAALATSNMQVTIVAATVAHIIGYFVWRRMGQFPGVASASNILPAFVFGHAAVFLVIFFFRLDYSRFQAAIIFGLCTVWYFAVAMATLRIQDNRLGVVPIGDFKRIYRISNINPHRLTLDTDVSAMRGVIADLQADFPKAWERFITRCALSGVPVYNLKQINESLTGRVEIQRLSENTLGSLDPNQAYLKIKQVIDWLAALTAGILLIPLFLAVAMAIRFETAGPILFRQQRVGYRGNIFTVYKFRSMVVAGGRDAGREAAITKAGDPRITKVGAFLRKTRIDELPQLINIIRGEMSWIGPRPEALPLSKWHEAKLPFYPYRHIVRPGISGWAQVSQGHVTDDDAVLEKLHYDFYYIKNFSPWLDIVIVLRTIRTMLTGFGAR